MTTCRACNFQLLRAFSSRAARNNQTITFVTKKPVARAADFQDKISAGHVRGEAGWHARGRESCGRRSSRGILGVQRKLGASGGKEAKAQDQLVRESRWQRWIRSGNMAVRGQGHAYLCSEACLGRAMAGDNRKNETIYFTKNRTRGCFTGPFQESRLAAVHRNPRN